MLQSKGIINDFGRQMIKQVISSLSSAIKNFFFSENSGLFCLVFLFTMKDGRKIRAFFLSPNA